MKIDAAPEAFAAGALSRSQAFFRRFLLRGDPGDHRFGEAVDPQTERF
jgi:hypothetical protein